MIIKASKVEKDFIKFDWSDKQVFVVVVLIFVDKSFHKQPSLK